MGGDGSAHPDSYSRSGLTPLSQHTAGLPLIQHHRQRSLFTDEEVEASAVGN